MLPRELVEPPLEGTPQAEIISVESQNAPRQHRLVKPIRERHGNAHHPSCAGPSHDLPNLDETEARRDLALARSYVCRDSGPGQSLEGLAEPPIAVAPGLAPRGQQQVM